MQISNLKQQIESEKKKQEDEMVKNRDESCGGIYPCNFIITGRQKSGGDSFVGLFTSRGREITYSLQLPINWNIIATSSVGGYEIHFSDNNSRGQESFRISKQRSEICVMNPENYRNISLKTKALLTKYKSIKSPFGTLQLSWKPENAGTDKFNFCQAKLEGYPDFVTETGIGDIYLNISEENYSEISKLINSIQSTEIKGIIYQ